MDSSNQNILGLRSSRLNGLVTRESYWIEIQKQLRLLEPITQICEKSQISLIFREGKIIVQISLLEMMNIEMYLDVEDIRSVPFSVIADGKYEPLLSDLILGLAAQSKYFLDIGANVGYYSISAAKINSQLKIKSFEPNPMIVEKFKRNIDLNQLSSQIEIFECGLGSENSDLTQMFIPQFTGSGGGSLKNLHPEEGKPDTLSIKVRILDELLNMDSATVDLMKIDVEGFEKYVLEGGMGTIRNYLPTIVIELLRKWMLPFNTSPQDVLQSLKLFGYRCYAIQKLKLLEIDEIDDMTEATNFIFVHPLREIHSEWLLGKAESSAK